MRISRLAALSMVAAVMSTSLVQAQNSPAVLSPTPPAPVVTNSTLIGGVTVGTSTLVAGLVGLAALGAAMGGGGSGSGGAAAATTTTSR